MIDSFSFTQQINDGKRAESGVYARSNQAGENREEQGKWRALLAAEAQAINPLHDVNAKRNQLVRQSLETGDSSKLNRFDAKQSPAWFEQSSGAPIHNKNYWGNTIESRIRSLREAERNNNEAAEEQLRTALEQATKKYNQAPGVTPYVVGFNNNATVAAQYDVQQPSQDWFNSKWNNSRVASQGRFTAQHWSENPEIKDSVDIKAATQENAQAEKISDEEPLKQSEKVTAQDLQQQYQPKAEPTSVTPAGSENDLHQFLLENLGR